MRKSYLNKLTRWSRSHAANPNHRRHRRPAPIVLNIARPQTAPRNTTSLIKNRTVQIQHFNLPAEYSTIIDRAIFPRMLHRKQQRISQKSRPRQFASVRPVSKRNYSSCIRTRSRNVKQKIVAENSSKLCHISGSLVVDRRWLSSRTDLKTVVRARRHISDTPNIALRVKSQIAYISKSRPIYRTGFSTLS